MRLLESEEYRGKQICVYVIYPEGPSQAAAPSLGVRVDGAVLEETAFFQDIHHLPDALAWGRRAVDRVLGMDHSHDPTLLPSPV